jgi:DNA-binding XRE family transcriptional regulator
MPNIGAVFREEIVRLSRKQGRTMIDESKKATKQHRRDIASLKRQVSALERQVKILAHRGGAPVPVASVSAVKQAKGFRFVAKGLRSQRARLGLSAADFAELVGVSAQSIYNWEMGSSHPRAQQLARLAALRGMGKRDAEARLKKAGPTPKKAAKS